MADAAKPLSQPSSFPEAEYVFEPLTDPAMHVSHAGSLPWLTSTAQHLGERVEGWFRPEAKFVRSLVAVGALSFACGALFRLWRRHA
jgi:hypothetical protein